MKINIVSREFIKPSSPTPSHLKDFKLSHLDQVIPPSYVPLILYYSYSSNVVPQIDMSSWLRESLSETLTKFYPLAGRMSTKDQSSVDCSDQGAYYLEARVDSQLSKIIQAPEVEILDRLLPHTLNGNAMVRVEEQLAIQVNMFQCGGIAIGICVNHRLADICTLGSFIRTWAATSRGGDIISSSNLVPVVIFESSSLFPPTILDSSSPNSTVQTATVLLENRSIVVSKRFVFSASAIAALKAKVASTCAINPTRVEVVSALLWKCGILSKTTELINKTSVALQVVNLRGRMVPPLKEHSFGNIFQMASAITTDGESTELGCLVAKFRAAIGTIDSEYIQKLLGVNGFEIVKSKFVEIGKMMMNEGDDVELFTFTSWCRFPNIYEADFGWGKPSWVSRASSATKNCVYLMDSTTKNEGGIEAWVVMDEQDMANFQQVPLLQSLISTFPCP